jgi:hypothetical protein
MTSITDQMIVIVVALILTSALPYFINKWSDSRSQPR